MNATAKPMRLSASSYVTFRVCPRLYYWSNVLRFERVREEGARRFGTMYHAGLEAWWRFMSGRAPWSQVDEALVVALKAIAENARHIQTNSYEVAAAEAMMTGYHHRYFAMEFQSAVVGDGVESRFEIPLLDEIDGVEIAGWSLVGVNDALQEFLENGKTMVVEHKHTASDIDLDSDYWARLAIDTQSSIYVYAARRLGIDVREVLYDVSKRPGCKPKLATPIEKRKFTKGKGCKLCGGRAGGKLVVAQGTGKIMVEVTVSGRVETRETKCSDCEGSGWSVAPALHADHRVVDESVDEYKARVADEILEDPNAYYRMMELRRNDDQLAECEADLAMTAGEISAMAQLSDSRSDGKLEAASARKCWPRNTQTCTNIYGRRCDFLDVCSGLANPWTSPLYQIRQKKDAVVP
ncbi:MAG: nuclease superfamily protein [Myxococcaceae bacterium]|nr:nuclease superfamily protein [Myxococcaceae bacterium]